MVTREAFPHDVSQHYTVMSYSTQILNVDLSITLCLVSIILSNKTDFRNCSTVVIHHQSVQRIKLICSSTFSSVMIKINSTQKCFPHLDQCHVLLFLLIFLHSSALKSKQQGWRSNKLKYFWLRQQPQKSKCQYVCLCVCLSITLTTTVLKLKTLKFLVLKDF